MANTPATTAQVAGRSWPSAAPPPGALTATEVRGRVTWLNPSITCSGHLGGLRRRRTQSATEVQGNSSKLPRANRRSPSARGRKLARHAGGDLLLAAPQHQVLRVLTFTRLIDVFPVYASVDEAARTAGLTRHAAAPVDGSPAPRRRDMISAASSVVWPLAAGRCCGAVRHRGGIYPAARLRVCS
jgi:hypothetical protein